MRLLTVLRIASIALAALAAPAVFAQTPDGETPSVETVCDPLRVSNGGTPGLYGLCVAYCEAQDCHDNPQCKAENPGDAWGAHSCSCEDVLANYNKKRQATDPEMPCILPAECPCFDADFLATEVANITVCVDNSGSGRDQSITNGSDALGCRAIAQAFTNFDGEGNPIARVCQAFNQDSDGSSCMTTLATVQSGLTEAEVLACQNLIRGHCAAPAP
jgi:hypothetical protein